MKAEITLVIQRKMAKIGICLWVIVSGVLILAGCINRPPTQATGTSSSPNALSTTDTFTPSLSSFSTPSKPSLVDLDGVIALASTSRVIENVALLFPENGEIRSLANLGSYSVSWSPNGDWIAFDGVRDMTNSDIYMIHPDGSGLTQITFSSQFESQLDWSPDSDRILFTSLNEGNQNDLSVVYIDDQEIINLTNTPESETYPSWSPDGEHIAYLSGGNLFSEYATLMIMNASGDNVRAMATQVILASVEWSPDGQWIAFISPNGPSFRCGDISAITFLDERVIEITHNSCVTSVSWSPDGRYMAFIGISDPDEDVMNMGSQIYIEDVNSGNVIQVTHEDEWFLHDIDWASALP